MYIVFLQTLFLKTNLLGKKTKYVKQNVVRSVTTRWQ